MFDKIDTSLYDLVQASVPAGVDYVIYYHTGGNANPVNTPPTYNYP